MQLHIVNETALLKAVVLGTAKSNGKVPTVEEAYDPKSIEHIKSGTYPKEKDMITEMEAVAAVLKKHNVKVYRPEIIENCNQIFSRDIAFVIEDCIVKSNILPDRVPELEAISGVLNQISSNKIITPPNDVHIEGGDVMLHNDFIFVGTYKGQDYANYITARTNRQGVQFLKEMFPNKKVIEFNLKKSNTNPYENALHLDCCFQPVGKGKAIIHKEGFLEEREYQFLVNLFGKENLFHITKEEMYAMNSNIFSISPEIVVSEKNFTRLNAWLRKQNILVEEVPYAEIAKQEGLLRCSTLPLIRE